MGEPTVAANRKEVASGKNGATVEEDVAAAKIQKQTNKQTKKADGGQQHGKTEPTVASNRKEVASGKNGATVEDVAAAKIQTQTNKQTKKADGGQQHGKTE